MIIKLSGTLRDFVPDQLEELRAALAKALDIELDDIRGIRIGDEELEIASFEVAFWRESKK